MTSDSLLRAPLDEFDCGVLIGVLIGEGTFGGDGRQPHVTLRMHTRHEPLFRWLVERFPRTRLYGPYTHGGRSYFQWMARGPALVHDVLPVLEQRLSHDLDRHAAGRLKAMCERYASYIERERARGVPAADGPSPGRPDSRP
ncbi:MAG: hypothetical protein ACTHQQ_02815 [Solirubrobacteraceae bacterium]